MTKCYTPLAFVAVLTFAACSQPNSGTYSPTTQSRTSGTSKPLSTYTIIYDFPATQSTPIYPEGPLYLGPGGNFYGTADGQNTQFGFNPYEGTIYEVNTSGSSPTVQTVYLLYGNGVIYSEPQTGVIRGADGALYGTSNDGGGGFLCYGGGSDECGYVFKLTKSGSTWSLTKYFKFGSTYTDGSHPTGPPLLVSGVLYGLTQTGGTNNCGTAYSINSNLSSGYKILYNFSCNDPHPEGPLVADSAGNLYGTLLGGASCASGGCGEVFELKPTGSTYTFKSLYRFKGSGSGDGANPDTGVTLLGASLLGTTAAGGETGCAGFEAGGCGTIFQLIPNNVLGGYGETILHKFETEALPSGLIAGSSSLYYGTARYNGSATCTGPPYNEGCGFLFSITTAGSFSNVHNFDGYPNDGAEPNNGTPAVDASGNVWGATQFGGNGDCTQASVSTGCGIVYEWSGSGPRKHTKLHRV